MINFDKLPQENPNQLPETGLYKAHIALAEMKQGKDASKPKYLNLKYALTNAKGESKGIMYDIMAESESSVVQYKMARFLKACGIPLVGSMELSDIGKLVVNKNIVVDLKQSPDDRGDMRIQVDPFTHEAYYPIGEFDEIYNIINKMKDDAGTVAPADRPAVESFINEGVSDASAQADSTTANEY